MTYLKHVHSLSLQVAKMIILHAHGCFVADENICSSLPLFIVGHSHI